LIISKYNLADILKECSCSCSSKLRIKNLFDIKIKIKFYFKNRPESSRFIDYPYLELNIIDNKSKPGAEEEEIERITLFNINSFERNSNSGSDNDCIEISLKNLGLVENQTQKNKRNKDYYDIDDYSLIRSRPEINFPLKDLSPEELRMGMFKGKEFLESMKANYKENYIIQVVNKCYRNKLSEFQQVEMKFLFVDLNL